MATSSNLPHVVVIGGGFGGLWTTRALAHAPVRVTLIDRTNHHVFHPLLYQVATAGLSGPDISAPLRHIVRRQRNATVWMDAVTAIDTARRRVRTQRQEITYDYLVVATGSECSYFGHNDWAGVAPGLKTLDDALAIRRRVLSAFEQAESEPDRVRRAALMGFVVVGGGATGVELAGTLAEMAHHTLPREFRVADPNHAQIHLVELGPRLLPALPERLSLRARRDLERKGVVVHTGQAVTHIDRDGVLLGDTHIDACTTLWAAGVAASPLARQLGAACDRAGRVYVRSDLSLGTHPEVFAIGDLAHVECAGRRVPGVAPAAKQMGRYVARVIRARIARRETPPFRYHDFGTLASIDRGNAVVNLHGLQLTGFGGWLFWLFVHILFLIGFRNRLAVMWNWAWSYFNWQRIARIITGDRLEAGPAAPAGDAGGKTRVGTVPAETESQMQPHIGSDPGAGPGAMARADGASDAAGFGRASPLTLELTPQGT